jgi:peptide/nickel transport system permease protein
VGRYLIRRVLFLVLVLFVVSQLTFFIFLKLPSGDPARRAVGRSTTPEQIANARAAFGLDKPWWVQDARFASGLVPLPCDWADNIKIHNICFLREDVYYSYGNFVAVKEEIFRRLPFTVTLTIGAALIWLLLGIPIGIISAVRRGTLLDRTTMFFALVGVSLPVFWVGYLMLYLFWFKFQQWFGGFHLPSSGIEIGDSWFDSVLKGKFLMPWVVLSITSAAFYARMVRGNLIETMSEDYIRTARAKGLPERRVVYKHGLRAALTPVTTMLGLDIGALLGGAFITETVFAIPGIGQLALKSIETNDFPMVMGITILGSLFIAAANLIVDVTYAFLDPRVRYT